MEDHRPSTPSSSSLHGKACVSIPLRQLVEMHRDRPARRDVRGEVVVVEGRLLASAGEREKKKRESGERDEPRARHATGTRKLRAAGTAIHG